MILALNDIKRILKDRPNKAMVTAAQAYSKKLKMHLRGTGLREAIERMEYFEKPELAAVRQAYAKSNKSMFARLHRPIDKVWTARGGSAYYYLPDGQQKSFREQLGAVEWGYSLREWVNTFWRPAYHDDPMGLLFMEVSPEGEAYPTFKSIFDIYDYQIEGRRLDYVIFEQKRESLPAAALRKLGNDKDYKLFRIVDEALDVVMAWDSSAESLRKIDSYPNYFGDVPALIVSDLYDRDKGMYISPDDTVIEDADQYLVEGSIYNVFKRRFGFPQHYRLAAACNTCMGQKTVAGSTCTACNGSGIKSTIDVSEIIQVPVPQGDDPVLEAGSIAGYITPDVKGWEKMREERALLFDAMHHTYWGTRQRDEGVSNETATGRFIDVQPVNERLDRFSAAAEGAETYITDMMGRFFYGQAYRGCAVRYGRRYLIETPDAIWTKYRDARKIGASVQALDKLLEEYYQAAYQADNLELQRHLKLMKVEPLIHHSLTECSQYGLYTDGTEYLKKLYYGEWAATLTVNDVLFTDVAGLRTKLADYVKALNVTAALPMAGGASALGENGQNTEAGLPNHGQQFQKKVKTDTMNQDKHPA